MEGGLKGVTTYRPNPVTGAVLEAVEEKRRAPLVMREEVAEAPMPETDLAGDGCDAMACTLPPPKPRPEPLAETCPECGEPTLVHTEGCAQCLSCDHSSCG